MFYLLVSAKTDIPYTELMGKSAEGMNATGSGDRRKWYDKCRSIQESVKDNLLVMYGIIAGMNDGQFVKFTDFAFNPLEEATEKELAENIKAYTEAASALVNLGAKQEEVFEWLKQFKQFNLDGLTFDAGVDGLEDYEDITPQVMAEFQAANEWREEDHPRGKDGKFGQGGGDDEEDVDVAELLGEEFTGVKGQAAVDKLMHEKKGHVKGAFTRKDIGDIDLVWGNERMGLAHIIKRRKETGQNLEELLNNLTDIIEKGQLEIGTNGRFVISLENKKAVIKPEFNNKKLQFVLTAFEVYKK